MSVASCRYEDTATRLGAGYEAGVSVEKGQVQQRPAWRVCEGAVCLRELKARLVDHGRWHAPLFDALSWAKDFEQLLFDERAAWRR